MDLILVPGRCQGCGCSDEQPCLDVDDEPCFWIDETHTLCSRCADKIGQDIEFGEAS